MTIDEMINTLQLIKEKLGTGEETIPIVTLNYGENDYFIPSFGTIGDFVDQDKNTFKCAFISKKGGEEFTERGTYHWKWTPQNNIQ
jgi:hypothetical protein